MQILKESLKTDILTQAKKEFVAKGFHEGSLRSIAKNAGCTVGNLYRYFKNKEALLEALLVPCSRWFKQYMGGHEEQYQTMVDAESQSFFHMDHESFAELLRPFCQELYHWRHEIIIIFTGCEGTGFAYIRRQFTAEMRHNVLGHLDRLKKKPGNMEVLAKALTESFFYGLVEILRSNDVNSSDNAVSSIVDYIIIYSGAFILDQKGDYL